MIFSSSAALRRQRRRWKLTDLETKNGFDRLEAETAKTDIGPSAPVGEIVQFSAIVLEPLEMMHRPLHFGYLVKVDCVRCET